MADNLLIAILAAGASRRLGTPKQLVKVDGEALIRRQCQIALKSDLGSVSVICGYQADRCCDQIRDLPVSICCNDRWAEGIASSIREAARTAIIGTANALLILHVDQYRITADDVRRLHATWTRNNSSPHPIVCRARHSGYAGPPIIFPSTLFASLQQLRGDEGARTLLSSLSPELLVDISISNAVHDLDTPEQLEIVVGENMSV
jgi:molybdenum cofactor cytidylyltransferase